MILLGHLTPDVLCEAAVPGTWGIRAIERTVLWLQAGPTVLFWTFLIGGVSEVLL